ncbi:acyl-homoserine-lactone synthase [Nocardia sp. alder85J]|uniref:acyl-homoserine-lactone synthase n=1 Tax=Nocardia sp. alder85J TaxID=2862949 RepID=UPI001CD7F42D|nr:acyl-homoserine-lactone synthase [Nocardia sp. alder85J]MCX4095853.1 GNAT family N-acetyltransferase [Nocardia sp. alder85J]
MTSTSAQRISPTVTLTTEFGSGLRIAAGPPGAAGMTEDLLDAQYRLRHEVFARRLRWRVTSYMGRERDDFDDLPPHYVLATDERGSLLGCCRLLPTTGPHMLRDTFAHALAGRTAPRGPGVWEISRFAIAPGQPFAGSSLGPIATELLTATLSYAADQEVGTLLAFSHLDIERKAARTGFPIVRLAPAITIESKLCTAYTITARTTDGP